MAWLWLILTLPAQVEHPLQQQGGLTATLTVTVPERVDRSTPPQVEMVVRVRGPGTLRVEPAQLGEEVRSWNVERTSTQNREDDHLTIAEKLQLSQTRPGMQALPGIRVRAWADAGAAPVQFAWPNPLGAPVVTLDPDIPLPEPSNNRLGWPLILAAITLGGLVALLIWLGVRRSPLRVEPTPREIAETSLNELTNPATWSDPRAAATRLSATLRAYLAERTGLDLHAKTVPECLALLSQQSTLKAEQTAALERLLLWCDTARFAGFASASVEGPERATEARDWLDEEARGWISER